MTHVLWLSFFCFGWMKKISFFCSRRLQRRFLWSVFGVRAVNVRSLTARFFVKPLFNLHKVRIGKEYTAIAIEYAIALTSSNLGFCLFASWQHFVAFFFHVSYLSIWFNFFGHKWVLFIFAGDPCFCFFFCV